MSEKLLVTQALDERDLVAKKITDKISKIKLVDTKKKNEEKTATEHATVDDFKKNAVASYQQIMDLIDRYQRIDAAITASNAATVIETSFGSFSVACAISLRNRLKTGAANPRFTDFEMQLAREMERQYTQNVVSAAAKNNGLESQAETMRLSILGKDSKIKDEKPLEVVNAFIRENTTEVIDPLDLPKKVAELKEKTATLIKELDTQIKVSNATTTITF